ncbi:MAG: nitroreductase family protein [Bacteroidales bacterium]|nr:nitroreductase family protein [Bacteroidales bacterium]
MKYRILFFLVILVSAHTAKCQSTTGNIVIDELLGAYSPRNFSSLPVTDEQLEIILKCGIKAPSARNLQPWKFTVVRNVQTMKELIDNALPGNVLIIISGREADNGKTPDFDCGLATQNMFIAATSLGLGARIYGSPVGLANEMKQRLEIPEGYKAVIILRVGHIEKDIDAVSSATSRNPIDDMVNYLNK